MNKHPSKITVIWSLWIISSAFFMRQVLNFIKSFAEGRNFKIAVSVFFILLVLGALRYIFRNKTLVIPPLRKAGIIVLFAAGIFFAVRMHIPEEQMHLINFGLLGWLLSADYDMAGSLKTQFMTFLVAVEGSLGVAATDELIQKFLPYRVGDIRDIYFALIGAAWGAAIYWISHSDRSL